MALEDIDRTALETTIASNTTSPRPWTWANSVAAFLVVLWYRLWGAGVSVREFGASTSATGAANSAAFQAAIDAVASTTGILFVPPGTYTLATALTYRSNVTIRGAGTQSTVLTYAGSGAALRSATPGVRSYNLRLRDLQISYTGASGGCLLLDDMSEASIERCAFVGAGIGIGYAVRITGSVSGYAVYNTFRKCRVQTALVGFDIAAIGSNDTHILDCRANVCETGIAITDSNHVVVHGCAIESGSTGVSIEATTSAVSDGCTIQACRFEGNSDNIVVTGTTANVRALQIGGNHHVDGAALTGVTSSTQLVLLPDSGTARGRMMVVSPSSSNDAFHLETTVANVRTAVIRSSNTGSGTPDVLRLSAGRGSVSHALSICTWNGSADTEFAYIDGAGNATMVGLTVSGNVTMHTAGQSLFMGDGSTSGNVSIVHRKADANNLTCREWRVGTSTTIWIEQHDSSENWNLLDSSAAVVLQIARTDGYVRAANGFRVGSTSGPTVTTGTGAPSSSQPNGSIYLRTDGAAGTTIYVRAAGAWSANA